MMKKNMQHIICGLVLASMVYVVAIKMVNRILTYWLLEKGDWG